MRHGPVDEELAEGIGAAAAQALAEIAEVFGREYELRRWLVNGRSRAPVAVVRETDHRQGRSRLLVLKVPTAERPMRPWSEVQRHLDAFTQLPDQPRQFANAHLSRIAADPQRAGDGSWIVLQSIAGDDIERVEVLTVLLNEMLDEPGRARCTAQTFADCCGAVVSGLLGDWAGRPYAPARLTVAEFLRRHILDQLEPGGRLHGWSAEHAGGEVEVPGEGRPLVNPFALARGAYFGADPVVPALVGRCHGDLHTDNVLVQVRPRLDVTRFHLIDLALYAPADPVTRDPAHLILYILARRMDVLSAQQRSAVIDTLLDPDASGRESLPGWLSGILAAVDGAFSAWLAGTGLQPDWRRQRLLSLAGCAMLFLGRKSTRDEDYPWFLRLAARAADKFVTDLSDGDRNGTLTAAPVAAQLGQRAASRVASRPALEQPPLEQRAAVPGAARPAATSRLAGVPGVKFRGRALLEVHLAPARPGDDAGPDGVNDNPNDKLNDNPNGELNGELAAHGRAARLFGPEEDVRAVGDATVATAGGAGLTVRPDGQRSAWQPLPQDGRGAVLDRADLAGRIAVMLQALAALPVTPKSASANLTVAVSPAVPVSAGSVDDLPRTRREPDSMQPIGFVTGVPVSLAELAAEPRAEAPRLADMLADMLMSQHLRNVRGQ